MGSPHRDHSLARQTPRLWHQKTATDVSLVDLRGQVELHEAVLAPLEVILHEQRGVRSKTQLYGTTERSGLCEIHEITQSECCCHGLVHRQGHPLFWPFSLPGLQHDIATPGVALDAESDALLACFYLHRLAELLEIAADPLKLCRRQPRCDLVLLLRDLHVLAFDLHQLQIEVSDAVITSTLELEADHVSTTLPAELQGVRRPTHFQDLREGLHIHPQTRGPVALEVCEGGLAQQERDQCNMRTVHGLHLQAFLAAVEIHVLAKVFHGVNGLLQKDCLLQVRLKSHVCEKPQTRRQMKPGRSHCPNALALTPGAPRAK